MDSYHRRLRQFIDIKRGRVMRQAPNGHSATWWLFQFQDAITQRITTDPKMLEATLEELFAELVRNDFLTSNRASYPLLVSPAIISFPLAIADLRPFRYLGSGNL
ncbi:hypothetical protein V5O48_011480 [Marasmius crinis-equi]|uniref:Uncharacterized protein n=1 Tax=Marasmius crinis-equi TaxID=585013 RepID=A0ABR3F5E2_9AGAR